jgi:hypothetical protein
MDYKQFFVRKWDREVVCRTRLLARAAVGTREGDEEDERWRETWEEVAVSHPLGNSMAELSSSLSLALDNSKQKLSSSLSTSSSHSTALPRQFRAEFSSSVSGSRSVSSNRQLLTGRIVIYSITFARALFLALDNSWQNCRLLSLVRAHLSSPSTITQNCHLLSLAHALAIALSLRSLWWVLDCTRFLFSRSQAFFSLFLFWHIYRYMRIPSFPYFGLCRILCVLWFRVSLLLVFAKQEVLYLKKQWKLLLSSTRGGEVCTRSE